MLATLFNKNKDIADNKANNSKAWPEVPKKKLTNAEKGWERGVIASKIANDLPHASYVNLGIGMPELVSQHIKDDREIIYHSETPNISQIQDTQSSPIYADEQWIISENLLQLSEILI